MAEPDFAALRRRMVEEQIQARGINDQRLLEAFDTVPREAFVGAANRARAYEDRPLPIGADQTISQPYIVALMIVAAGVGSDDHVLEVGAGSGYAAAILGKVAKDVLAVERVASLAEGARERIAVLGLTNVDIVEGDGSIGWPAKAPFDVILVAAAGPAVPRELLEQLSPGGRLVMPVGSAIGSQTLLKIVRSEAGFVTSDLGGVRFVPLIGAGV